MEISLIFCLCSYLLCRRGNNRFDDHLRLIGTVPFLWKEGKVAVCEGRNGRKGFISRQSRHPFPLINNIIEVLFSICTLI